ncbi:MAG: CotH kinase family protein [Saprospiraceae bacterium]|nr:CotH kinase family protein [Saprospiraceae bacterium]
MFAKTLVFFFTLVFSFLLTGQSLPTQWNISEDGRYLSAGKNASIELYDATTVEEIRLYFPQTNYWNLLTQNYNAKIDLPASLTYKGETLDSVGVRFKGQTSYFMNNSQKKSFNLSIDAFKEDQKLKGYKTLNLNNGWEDPTFMREVLYYALIRPHTPVVKANFVKLYINDQYWGIYLNVQQLNKDFLEEWYASNDGNNFRADSPTGTTGGGGGGGGPQWGDGTAAVNFLGTDSLLYQKYYTLKSSGYNNPWTELIEACNVLNNSGTALEQTLPEHFDLDKILWHLACEIAFVDDDSYVYKGKMDYYLYQDDITGRWTTHDYDANSTMSNNQQRITWSPFYNENKPNYPLLNKVLSIPAFRQRYLAHMRTILNTSFDETRANALINSYDVLIKDHVFADTKKPTTNANYTSGVTGLKNFIKNRKAFLLTNTEVNRLSPSITDAKYICNGIDWGQVTDGDQVLIVTRPEFSSGISEVFVWLGEGLPGVFSKMHMNDSGTNGDETGGDGIYSVSLPRYNAGELIKFYIEVIGNDASRTRTYFPAGAEHEVMIFNVKNQYSGPEKISINEFMASNDGIIKDEFDEAEDWIELFNLTNQDINMTGYSITDKADNPVKYVFPEGTVIKANGFLIVWADEDSSTGSLHANFKLSASGEDILLFDNNQNLLDQVNFGAQTLNKSAARKPNGTGNFVIGDHTFNKNNDGTTDTKDEAINTLHIKMYPNPASETVILENNGNVEVIFEVFTQTGVKVRNISLPATSTTLLNNLTSGVYLLKSGNITKKLVVL